MKTCIRRILVAAGLATGLSAAATPASPILSCWDGTFAYTETVISEVAGQPNLIQVRLASQQLSFLNQTVTGPLASWGRGSIEFYLDKSNCTDLTGQPKTINCHASSGTLAVRYDEDAQSSRILNLSLKDLEFSTTPVGDLLKVKLTFRPTNSSYVRDPSTAELVFPLDRNSQCRWHGRQPDLG